MLAQITPLRYWKSEHDEQTCEDALGEAASRGLFAVADGVGTTLFSNRWARLLVDHFLDLPLLSNAPFEVEWWLRLAQERYQQEVPVGKDLPWNALQKAQSQGSYTTLATLCVTRVDATSANASLLSCGDSCILVKHAEQVQSFPLEQASDFDAAPVSFPSKLSAFSRYFHRCLVKQITLEPGDTLMLATDAVARWVVSAGSGSCADLLSSFQQIAAQTPASWPTFVTERRARNELVDDDSTALVIALFADEPDTSGSSEQPLASPLQNKAIQLGTTTEHRKHVREQRVYAFVEAQRVRNNELVAITYGDGVDLALEGVSLPENQLQHARAVADAMREMLQILRSVVNNANPTATLDPAWQKYAPLLQDEPCAMHLRQTLTRLGVHTSADLPPADNEDILAGHDADDHPAEPDASEAAPRSRSRFDVREMLKRKREQLELERRLLKALRLDDDRAIVAAYNAICQSPFMSVVTSSPRREQRIQLAQQREHERRRLHRALSSKHAGKIASMYEAVAEDASLLSEDGRNIVQLAYAFITALHTDDAAAILAAAEQIQHSAYAASIVFTPQEKQRLAQARLEVAEPDKTSNFSELQRSDVLQQKRSSDA